MERQTLVRRHLLTLEQILRDHSLWQGLPPDSAAFESSQPFCMDTLQPHEWLQWVLIPRMHALLDSQHPLPEAFAVAPYYEMALDATHAAREPLLAALVELDALFDAEKG
ncbi:YqcC family protein [Cedecea sp.]|jgi:uncharacterized protein YqcC (DUF446 family)|uniref:YqcC family protein n=1 Tax=Cedecea sp. TaxID=1970739 RepID=UPI0012AE7314|nr:hypothetical protein [Enterobacteriaceae bacterium RIT693]